MHLYPFLLEQTPHITANRVIRAMYPETYLMRGVPRRSDCGCIMMVPWVTGVREKSVCTSRKAPTGPHYPWI